MQTHTPRDPAARIKLVAAWAFVGIPFLWAVRETAANALKLFR